MAAIIPVLNPALQLIYAGTPFIWGPFPLVPSQVALDTNGYIVESVDVQYATEVLGPWLSSTYEQRFKFLGVRPQISINFGLVKADDNPSIPTYGLRLLESLWAYGNDEPGGNRLQFTLFNTGATAIWRDVFSTAPWEPKKLVGKQVAWTVEMKLACRDLVPMASKLSWCDGKW